MPGPCLAWSGPAWCADSGCVLRVQHRHAATRAHGVHRVCVSPAAHHHARAQDRGSARDQPSHWHWHWTPLMLI